MDLHELLVYSSSSFIIHLVEDDDCDLFFDDDDDETGKIAITMVRLNKIPRVSVTNFMEEVVQNYSDSEFVRFFRISRDLFNSLSAEYEKSSIFQTIAHKYGVVSPDKTIAIFLWFCGHECVSFRDLSNLFNLSTSTIHQVILRSISFFSSLSSKVIVWPTVQKMTEESNHHVTKSGIPGIIGAVGGTKIPIDPPSHRKDDYIDRKGNITLSVQAVCNYQKKFVHVCIGFPGSAHNAEIFQFSQLPELLPDCPAGSRLLGDSAYPCLPALLVPFKDNGRLTEAQKLFNYKLSLSRVMIEHTFGIWKQRLRQMYYCKLRGMKVLCHFIRACCVLHNLSNEDDTQHFELEVNPQFDNDTSSTDMNLPADVQSSQEGKNIRNEICKLLWANRRERHESVNSYCSFVLYFCSFCRSC